MSEHYTNSDHQAVLWEVTCDLKIETITTARIKAVGWKAKSFHEDVFRLLMLDGVVQDSTAHEKMENVLSYIIDACDASVPRKRVNNNRHVPVHWRNDETASLRKECFEARR